MNLQIFTVCVLNGLLMLASEPLNAVEMTKAMRLDYREFEESVEPYTVTYTVTSDYIRIDDESDNSGFIVFDINKNKIFSVSHLDKSILVIAKFPVADFKPEFEFDIQYQAIDEAPKISGKSVYSYRVKTITSVSTETCMDIQLVPGLLPEVAKSLQAFQKIVSGQHVANLHKTPEEFRTPCYLIDLVYNKGDYYSRGLPVAEWHSNGKMRQLLNFEETEVDASIFNISGEYRQYSLQ